MNKKRKLSVRICAMSIAAMFLLASGCKTCNTSLTIKYDVPQHLGDGSVLLVISK